jgi:hypothetical protein
MSRFVGKLWRLFIHGRIFSPMGFLFRAVIIVAIFLLLEALGLRKYAMVISGTSPTADAQDMFAMGLACLYLLFYVAVIVLAPILFLASLFFYLLTLKVRKPREDSRDSKATSCV